MAAPMQKRARGLQMFSLANAFKIHQPRPSVVKNLKSLAFDGYIKQADTLPPADWPEEWENFSDVLKKEILEYFLQKPEAMRNSENMNSFVQLLLSNEVRALNLYDWHVKGLWAKDTDNQVLQMLQAVVHKAPNLEHLTIHCTQHEPHTIREVFGYIKQMKNLKYLSLDFINSGLLNEHIHELPLRFPEMEILKLKLNENVSKTTLTNFPLMTKLKEFHFHFEHTTTPETVNQLYTWCINHLPNLRLVGQSAENDSGRNTQTKYKLTPSIENDRPQLEHLHCFDELPEADLPDLKHLIFKTKKELHNFYYESDYSEYDARIFNRIVSYSNLTDLTYLHSAGAIYLVLERIGAQLTKFCCGEHSLDYFRILYLCPNLRQLTQGGYYWSHSKQSEFSGRIAPPAHLKECGIKTWQQLPTGLLKLILAAPNLECLSVEGARITKDECKIPRKMSAVGFPKLKQLRFVTIQLATDNCTLRHAAKMIKAMVCLSPNLEDAVVSWQWPELHNKWKALDAYQYLNLMCAKARAGEHGKYSLCSKQDGMSSLTQWHFW